MSATDLSARSRSGIGFLVVVTSPCNRRSIDSVVKFGRNTTDSLSETRMTVMRLLILLCAVTGGLMLGGCHYTEEEKWSVCCVLYVRADQTATDEARTVIGRHRQSDYDGNGRGGQGYYDEGKTFYSDKDDKIRSDVASFLADNPEKRATDYFIGLGMTCGSYSTASGTGGTRCQIALPVRVICGPTYRFLPGTTPIPERLKKPLAGVLHVSVDLPTGRALKTSSRVDPVPGGQLCHR